MGDLSNMLAFSSSCNATSLEPFCCFLQLTADFGICSESFCKRSQVKKVLDVSSWPVGKLIKS